MTVKISPVFNEVQYFDADGNPLAGGKIYQYQAGSDSIQKTTYSDGAGTIPNSNPIVLDASGRSNTAIWLTDNTTYNLVLTNSSNTPITNFDNITGTVSSGGGGGVTFPLTISDVSDEANDAVAWSSIPANFPQFFDTRIRGTTGTVGDNEIIMRMDSYIDEGDYGIGWQTGWEIYPVTDPCCCGAPPTTLVMHVPNLVVDQLSGISLVNNLTAGGGLSVSSNSGYINMTPTMPAKLNTNATISTTLTKLMPSSNNISISSGGDQLYRFTINGHYTATAAGINTTFNVKFGNTDSASDTTIATWTFTGDIGSSIPFKLVIETRLNPASGFFNIQNSSVSLNNQGTTGISTMPWSGGAVQNGSVNWTSGWMNLYAQTNSANGSFVANLAILERVL